MGHTVLGPHVLHLGEPPQALSIPMHICLLASLAAPSQQGNQVPASVPSCAAANGVRLAVSSEIMAGGGSESLLVAMEC